MDIADPIKAIDAALASAGRLIDLVDRLAKLFRRQPDEAEGLKRAVVALHEEVLAAKEQAVALRQENSGLREQLHKLQQRAKDLKKMTLVTVPPGAAFYVVKGIEPTAQDAVRYCQACIEGGQKTALQFAERKFYFDRHECPRCGASIQLPNDNRMDAQVVSVRRGGRYEEFTRE